MAHKGRTIKRIIGEIESLMQTYQEIKASGKQTESLNPYCGIGINALFITTRVAELNEGYLFDSEPSKSVIKEYISIVYQEMESLGVFCYQHRLEFDTAINKRLFSLVKELATLAKNLQEKMNSIQPASPLLAYYNGNAEKVEAFKLELQKHKALSTKKVVSAFLSQMPMFTEWSPTAIAEALSTASGIDISKESIIQSKQIKEYRFND